MIRSPIGFVRLHGSSFMIRQQLTVQTLGIANQRPQTLLGLF
ncbi:hypothetical protein [Nisaea sediminum]|nr:hypothetical protein [Nisaea sediminum]